MMGPWWCALGVCVVAVVGCASLPCRSHLVVHRAHAAAEGDQRAEHPGRGDTADDDATERAEEEGGKLEDNADEVGGGAEAGGGAHPPKASARTLERSAGTKSTRCTGHSTPRCNVSEVLRCLLNTTPLELELKSRRSKMRMRRLATLSRQLCTAAAPASVLNGKHAIITGAGGGIGRTVALEFAKAGCATV